MNGVGTSNCVRCLRRRATIFGGHVTYDSHRVTAGWCSLCRSEVDRGVSELRHVLPNRKHSVAEFLKCTVVGWCGHWLPEMGFTVYESPTTATLELAGVKW